MFVQFYVFWLEVLLNGLNGAGVSKISHRSPYLIISLYGNKLVLDLNVCDQRCNPIPLKILHQLIDMNLCFKNRSIGNP